MFVGVPIRFKLALLPGIPVLGALLLSLFVVRDAREEAAKAEALGTIEDLAALPTLISDAVDAVEQERTQAAFELGRVIEPVGGFALEGAKKARAKPDELPAKVRAPVRETDVAQFGECTEARDAEGQMFDLPRLENLIAEAMVRFDADLDRVADHVMETVNAFAEARDDDWTLLLVRRRL